MKKFVVLCSVLVASLAARAQSITITNTTSQAVDVTLFVFAGGPILSSTVVTLPASTGSLGTAVVTAWWFSNMSATIPTGSYVDNIRIEGHKCPEIVYVDRTRPNFVSCEGSPDELNFQYDFNPSTKDVVLSIY